MKKTITFLCLSFTVFFASAFEFPFGGDNQTTVVFSNNSSGAHLALPQGYYSYVTQALNITFNDAMTSHFISIVGDDSLVCELTTYGPTAYVPCYINQPGSYTVLIAPDDLSEPIYTGTFVVSDGDLSFGELDRVHHSPFEAFII